MNIKLNLPVATYSGQIVNFTAPCDCADVTGGLNINGESYTICNAVGDVMTGKRGVWSAGALVSVILECEQKKAFVQNGHAAPEIIGALATDGSNHMTGFLDSGYADSAGRGRFYGNDYGAYLESITAENAMRRLFIANSAALADLKSAISFTDENGTVYDIGKHNKPNGIYGGSSNIPYTVEVGAAPSSAGVLSVSSDSGFFALVTYDGAVCVNSITGEIKVLASGLVNFRGGNLYLNTVDAYVNYEGFPYHYQAL